MYTRPSLFQSTLISLIFIFVVTMFFILNFVPIIPKNLYALRNYYISPVLKNIGLYSQQAENLMFGTAMQETCGGILSSNVFQIIKPTANDLMKNYLPQHPQLQQKVLSYYNSSQDLEWNLNNNINFEIALARVYYFRADPFLPSGIDNLGYIWKKYYNTYEGAGTALKFINMYQQSSHGHIPPCYI